MKQVSSTEWHDCQRFTTCQANSLFRERNCPLPHEIVRVCMRACHVDVGNCQPTMNGLPQMHTQAVGCVQPSYQRLEDIHVEGFRLNT